MLRENFQKRLQDFKSGTGISYVSITFRGRQEMFQIICKWDKSAVRRKTLQANLFSKKSKNAFVDFRMVMSVIEV